MDPSNLELTTLAASPVLVGLIVSFIAAVRKYVPSIDGWKNLVLAVVLSEIVAICFRVIQHPSAPMRQTLAEGIIGGVVLAVAAIGTNEKANNLIDRHAKASSKTAPHGDQRGNGVGYGSSSPH